MAKGFYCLFCDKAFTDVVDAQAEAIAHTEKCGQEMTDTIARLTRERDEAVAEARKAIDIMAGARARDSGLTIDAVRDAIGDYENEGISFGKLVEVCRFVSENLSREDIARLSRENEKLRESLRYIAGNEIGLTRERDEARAERDSALVDYEVAKELLDDMRRDRDEARAAAAQAKASERARVVAWLRGQGAWEKQAAASIEAGEHDKKGER